MKAQFQLALENLQAAKSSHDNDAVAKILMELEITTLEVEKWPDGLYDGLEGFLKDQEFLSLKNSWKLPYFINNNLEMLLPQERERLRWILAEAFDKYGDFMGSFLTSEILGENYADEETLAILVELLMSANMVSRAAVPHGLEYLAKSTSSELVRTQAINQLKELQKSHSVEIRKEAITSLRKLM
jgi:hypothetical protein